MNKSRNITAVSKAVVCPFYKYHTRTSSHERYISCEGISKDTSVNLLFGTREELTEYRKCVCESLTCYSSCPIYRAVEATFRNK